MTDPPTDKHDDEPDEQTGTAAPESADIDSGLNLNTETNADTDTDAYPIADVVDQPVPVVQQAYETPRLAPPESDAGTLRIVIVVWCFWLLGAWAAAWLSDTSVPRVRWMLFAGTFGLMLVWPAFRLSERVRPGNRQHRPVLIFLDWLAMVGVYQAVIWSLHLIAIWPLERGVWLDLAIVSWSLLSALIVAAARLWPTAAARLVGMLLCIALVFAEPVLIWMTVNAGGEAWPLRVSLIQAIWELTQPPNRSTIAPWDQRTMTVGLTAVAGWGALVLWWIGEKLFIRRRLDGAPA